MMVYMFYMSTFCTCTFGRCILFKNLRIFVVANRYGMVVTGTLDGTMTLWDTATSKQRLQCKHSVSESLRLTAQTPPRLLGYFPAIRSIALL